MAICSAILSASLVERRLAYSATCLVRVMFAVVRFFTEAQSSAVACDRFADAMDISMEMFVVPLY